MAEPAEPASDEGPPAPAPGPAGARRLLDPVLGFHEEHPIYFWLAVVGLVGAVLAVGSAVAPEVFLHHYIWEDIWGPTVADANQRGSATRYGVPVTEDYTLRAEITYGLILVATLPSLYVHLFRKRGIVVDARFIGALVPYILFGPLARSLEDASVFCEITTAGNTGCDPGLFATLFISPFIYLFAAAAVITHLLLAHRTREAPVETQRQVVAAWLGAQAALYAFLFYAFRDEFVVMVHPAVFVAIIALSYAFYHVGVGRGGEHRPWALAAWGLPMALVPVVLIGQWTFGAEWVSHSREAVPEVIPVVFGITALILAALAFLGYALRDKLKDAASFLVPLNLGLVAGHMIDGFATFTAICSNPSGSICGGAAFLGVGASGYGEKHPVSAIFLEWLDGWAFPLMKLLLVTVIIVLIDRSAREGDEHPTLIGLVKLAVLVLGLGPGLRDVVRVAMGV